MSSAVFENLFIHRAFVEKKRENEKEEDDEEDNEKREIYEGNSGKQVAWKT